MFRARYCRRTDNSQKLKLRTLKSSIIPRDFDEETQGFIENFHFSCMLVQTAITLAAVLPAFLALWYLLICRIILPIILDFLQRFQTPFPYSNSKAPCRINSLSIYA